MGFWDALPGNIGLGVQISNQVTKTLLQDKELFIYPAVMAVLSFLILLVVFIPVVLLGGLTYGPLALVVIFLVYYLVTTFIATYFLFALYIAFKSFVQGKKIGMLAALSQASSYTSEIIGWTIFYAVVMTLVRVIESYASRNAIIGWIVNAAIGIGLFLGMTFAIPIIFEDSVGPWEAVKRSAKFIINNIGKTFKSLPWRPAYLDDLAFAGRAPYYPDG